MGKRIAIVTPTYPPYRGGIGKVAAQDAIQLRALGHAVDVYAPSRDAGADALPLWTFVRYGNAAFTPGVAFLPRRYDIVMLHYPFFGGAEPLACAKRVFGGAKLVVTYHMDVIGSGIVRAIARIHRVLCLPHVLAAADRVLVTSFDYARNSNAARFFGRQRGNFREIAPSVDSARFFPGPKPARLLEKYGIPESAKVVLFVGGLDAAHYFKGVPLLLATMTTSALSDTRLVIVGDGDLRSGFAARAREIGVAERTTFAGSVSEEDLPDHYRLADVFAFPSLDRSEAFGIAALEALASGVPVVASDLPGVRTIVREGETGLRVRAGSVSALAARLGEMFADSARRTSFGLNGRRMAETEFSETVRKERLARLIEELT